MVGGFADVDATWQWGPLVSVTPSLFSLSPSFSLLFRLSSLLSLLPARRLLARRRCKPPPSSLQTAGGRAAGGAAGGGRLKLGRETGARAGGWLGGRSGSRRRWRLGLPCLVPSPMEGGADPRCLLAGVPALGLAGGSPALLDLLRRRARGSASAPLASVAAPRPRRSPLLAHGRREEALTHARLAWSSPACGGAAHSPSRPKNSCPAAAGSSRRSTSQDDWRGSNAGSWWSCPPKESTDNGVVVANLAGKATRDGGSRVVAWLCLEQSRRIPAAVLMPAWRARGWDGPATRTDGPGTQWSPELPVKARQMAAAAGVTGSRAGDSCAGTSSRLMGAGRAESEGGGGGPPEARRERRREETSSGGEQGGGEQGGVRREER